jgi:hypothetical protein
MTDLFVTGVLTERPPGGQQFLSGSTVRKPSALRYVGTDVMSEPMDLRRLLQSWPYDPSNAIRLARGEDGREIIQVRLPLGVEQYELDGRPDGVRPHGMESALDHHLARVKQARAAGEETGFSLSEEDCAELFAEGTLFYYRYLHLFQLRDWRRTIRDTARNIGLFDFVHRYAAREEDQMHLEKWRPYIIRMHGVATAMLELERGKHDRALEATRAAMERIEELDDIEDETFRFERRRSMKALQEVVEQIRRLRPVPELERLEAELQRAIDTQEFERAAGLRDRIRALRQQRRTG